MKLSSKLGAEFIGTYVLVFGGTGSAVLAAKFLDPAARTPGSASGSSASRSRSASRC